MVKPGGTVNSDIALVVVADELVLTVVVATVDEDEVDVISGEAVDCVSFVAGLVAGVSFAGVSVARVSFASVSFAGVSFDGISLAGVSFAAVDDVAFATEPFAVV